PSMALASQTALNTCHLLALAPAAQLSAALCPAIMARVNDRRPKGVVEMCSIISSFTSIGGKPKTFRNVSSG
ncbi:hypothetical protein, partial [Aminobacter sp. MET-1]|uniref:hypothetical protein n=1 Tax=Aminobacter sp. MET-1 TaxID=2951085 RepID=UPI00226A02C3